MRLKDKVCVVTGSSRGIGRSIAEAFAKEGAIVVVTYETQERAALEVASECRAELCLKMDVRDRASVRGLFRAVNDRYGRVDVLVNNAGINRPGDFDELTQEDWQDVIDVNLTGVFTCCQEVLPFISEGGRVINIGSLSGQYGGPRTASYAAAKAGVMALTHCLARFLGEKSVCVNCLSPGVIEGEFTDSTMAPSVATYLDNLLLIKRKGTASDVATSAVFLASDEASYITAQTIAVNGGAWV